MPTTANFTLAHQSVRQQRQSASYLSVWLMSTIGWATADCDPTPRKPRWSDLCPVSNWTRFDTSSMPIMLTIVPVSDTVRDLGVIFDSRLTMSDQVAAVCRSGCYQLWQLCSVVQSLSVHGTAAVVHAFIACRLDYCLPVSNTRSAPAKSVQNAAVRLMPACGDVNTSRRYWSSYTGCRSVSASVTSWWWCSKHYRARHWTTLSMTVSSWPTLDDEPWGQLSDGFASYWAATVRLVTDRLLLLVHEFGTTCQPNSGTPDRQSKLFANIWKLYCFLFHEAAAHLWQFDFMHRL